MRGEEIKDQSCPFCGSEPNKAHGAHGIPIRSCSDATCKMYGIWFRQVFWNRRPALDRDRPNPANGFSGTSSDGAEISRGQPLDFMQS